MQSYSFHVQGNPLPLPRHRTGKGHRYIPTPVREWQELVAGEALAARTGYIKGPLKLWLTFYRNNRVRCDIDNLAKAVMDALQGVAYDDDSQIVELVVRKTVRPNNPGCGVTVWLT